MQINTLPILTTENLVLRQLSTDDCQDIFVLRSDPEVNKYLNRPISKTAVDALNFIARVNENIENQIALYWAITLKETKTFVGTICLFDFSTETNRCEIGYELLTKFQGQGIMIEAAQKLIEFAFQTLGITNIVACPHAENHRSIHLLLKLNFINTFNKDPENAELMIFNLSQ